MSSFPWRARARGDVSSQSGVFEPLYLIFLSYLKGTVPVRIRTVQVSIYMNGLPSNSKSTSLLTRTPFIGYKTSRIIEQADTSLGLLNALPQKQVMGRRISSNTAYVHLYCT
jgi:hypothetical protein